MEQCYILTLPSELLVTIINFLTTRDKLHVRMTCCHLYSTMSDPIFWEEVSWSHYNFVQDVNPLKTVLRLGTPTLRSLEISAPQRFALSKYRTILSKCKGLKSVSLTGFRISKDQIETLLTILPNLYHIEFEESFKCSARHFFQIAPISKSLQSVFLHKVCSILDLLRDWTRSGYSPSDVGVSVLKWSTPITGFYFINYVNDELEPLPSTHNTRLSLYAVSDSQYVLLKQPPFLEIQFDPKPIMSVAHCDELRGKWFSLARQNSLSQDCISAVLCSPRFFEQSWASKVLMLPSSILFLSFGGILYKFGDLDSNQLALVASMCPNLIQLDISGCTKALSDENGLRALVSECKNLRGLNINGIHRNEITMNVTVLWELLSQLKKLNHLYLMFCLMCPPVKRGSVAVDREQGAESRARKSHATAQSGDTEKMGQYAAQMKSLKALEVSKGLKGACRDYCAPQNLATISNVESLQYLHMHGKYSYPVNPVLSQGTMSKLCQLTHLVTSDALTLPSDSNCYQSLEYLCVKNPSFYLRDDIVCALTHHRKLTHIKLECRSTREELGCLRTLIRNSPRLHEFHLCISLQVAYISMVKELESTLKAELKSRGVVQFSIKFLRNTKSYHDDEPSLWNQGSYVW